jgi:NADH dehydrogenase
MRRSRWSSSSSRSDRISLSVEAAAASARAGVVLVSVVGAAADSPLELSRAKYAAEQNLRASGVPWTIVRASAFAELWAEIMTKPVVFGRGNNPVNFVSVSDVAAAVAAAAPTPGCAGRSSKWQARTT